MTSIADATRFDVLALVFSDGSVHYVPPLNGDAETVRLRGTMVQILL